MSVGPRPGASEFTQMNCYAGLAGIPINLLYIFNCSMWSFDLSSDSCIS